MKQIYFNKGEVCCERNAFKLKPIIEIKKIECIDTKHSPNIKFYIGSDESEEKDIHFILLRQGKGKPSYAIELEESIPFEDYNFDNFEIQIIDEISLSDDEDFIVIYLKVNGISTRAYTTGKRIPETLTIASAKFEVEQVDMAIWVSVDRDNIDMKD